MGIGGKPEKLLNMEAVRRDEVTVIKRFSGGGTVVLDTNSLWTTLIGRKDDFPSVEAFPRPIMQWSAEAIFGPAFKKLNQQLIQKHLKTGGKRTLVVDSKSCSNDNSGRVITLENGHLEIPEFALRENDYILGDRKMGGNAQCIIKDAWLHHTSFLWDFDSDIMNYLTLPDKRPAYRQDRSHDDFLVRLKDVYQGLQQRHFVASLQEASADEFDLQPVSLQEVMTTVKAKVGGLQEWLDTKSRTKVVTS
jgi:lipoate-protein ligase A